MTRVASLLVLSTFFASGCAALIYQLVWQRYLFTGLGVDIDSVTLIVSTFMLGIGVGGAVGGWLADRWPRRRLHVYALAELTLALIGVMSPWVFAWVQSLGAAGWSFASVSVIAVVIVLLPTTVMGTTLPVLTMHFDEVFRNVGVSVGMLYFSNTVGAAFGTWLTSRVLFIDWGLNASAHSAAAINATCFVLTVIAALLVSSNALKNQEVRV